jgi:hypothetical protein
MTIKVSGRVSVPSSIGTQGIGKYAWETLYITQHPRIKQESDYYTRESIITSKVHIFYVELVHLEFSYIQKDTFSVDHSTFSTENDHIICFVQQITSNSKISLGNHQGITSRKLILSILSPNHFSRFLSQNLVS